MSSNNCLSSDHSDISATKPLQDALHEVQNLKVQNNKLKDALHNFQKEIINFNCLLSYLGKTDVNITEAVKNFKDENTDELFTELKVLTDHLKNCKDSTDKINFSLENNLDSELLHSAFLSSLNNIEEKLSSLKIVIEQFNQKAVTKVLEASHSYLDSSVDEIQQQLGDALYKNSRWQSYNVEREQYVSLLLSKYNQNCSDLQKLRERYAQLTSQPDKLAAEQRRYFDKLLVGARQELESQRNVNRLTNTELTILKDKHKDELHRLEASVEYWRKRYEEQREALAALNANYENEKRRSNNNAIESKEKQSQIQLLQRQVQLFSEDFRAERKEKDIAFNEIDFLKLKSKQLQLELEKFKKPPVAQKNSYAINKRNVNNKINNKFQKQSTSANIKSGDLPEIPPPEYSHLDEDSITTRKASPVRHKNARHNFDLNNKRTMSNEKILFKSNSIRSTPTMCCNSDSDSLLQCPTCGKQYNVDEHLLLLDHIDLCGD